MHHVSNGLNFWWGKYTIIGTKTKIPLIPCVNSTYHDCTQEVNLIDFEVKQCNEFFLPMILKLNISIVMRYTMLCMLKWMQKGKHRIGTLRTRRLRGSALTAYIHGGIP